MDFSTLIVLAIAALIIVYRVKTWSDPRHLEKDVVEDIPQKRDEEPEPVKSEAASKKSVQSTEVVYRKEYKSGSVKNEYLVKACNGEGEVSVMRFASQPKRGVTTLVTLSKSEGERAVGAIYEVQKEQMTLIKSFDVKMGANGSFKVATSFSKSQSIRVEEMKPERIKATHFMGHDGVVYSVDQVALSLK